MKILTSKFSVFIISSLFCLFIAPNAVLAQENQQTLPKEERLEAVVTKIQEEKEVAAEGTAKKNLYQRLEVVVTSEKRKGDTLVIENNMPVVNAQRYKVGDKVV